MNRIDNHIGGENAAPLGGGYLDNVDPATGAVYSQVADSDARDVVRAVDAADAAFPAWSRTPARERSAVLLRIADLSRMELRVFLDEEDLDLVRVGQSLPVLVDALEGEELTGRVIWISSEAEFTPKNVQTRQARTQLVYAVKLEVGNLDGRLHIGMPAEVRVSP